MSVTVNRALGAIEFCATAPRTLTEITQHLGVHKSTALRLMQTLEEGGFARVTGGRYTIGFRMITLASAASRARSACHFSCCRSRSARARSTPSRCCWTARSNRSRKAR